MSQRVWILSDSHKIGTINQCLALAKALNLRADVKKITPRFPWKFLPPSLWMAPLSCQSRGADDLNESPGPDLIIASGRASVAPALALRKKWGAKVIFIQNPRTNLKSFDVVVPPYHDALKGENILPTLGALASLSSEDLKGAVAAWKGPASQAPHPRWAFLLGGDTPYYTYEIPDIEKIGRILKKIVQGQKGSLLVTPSRRTRPVILEAFVRCLPKENIEVWNGEPPNPYLAYLGLADKIIVTSDSISMMSEACSTGKPVYIAELPKAKPKHIQFCESLYRHGHARPLKEDLSFMAEEWEPIILDEATRVAVDIRNRLGLS